MECSDCNKVLRYAQKKYVRSRYEKRERVMEYRCEACHYDMKEKAMGMFRDDKDGV